MKLLIADDEVRIRKGLYNLIRENFDIELLPPVKNGLLALESIQTNRPDIVLVDINMPKLNGLDLIRSVKDCIPNASIIIISGHDEFQYAKEAIGLGVDAYMLKPVDCDALIKCLGEQIDKLKKKSLLNIEQQWTTQQLKKHKNMLVEDFLSKCCTGEIASQAISESAKHLNFHLDKTVYLQGIHAEYLLHDTLSPDTDSFERLQTHYRDHEIPFTTFMVHNKPYLLINAPPNKDIQPILLSYCTLMKEKHGKIVVLKTAKNENDLFSLCSTFNRLKVSSLNDYGASERILEALQLITLEYSNPELTLQSIAKEINVTHEYLSRLFKKEMNISPKQYLTNLRLSKAFDLITTHPTLKVYEVASQTGFSSQHYFCKAFKKYYGCPPSKIQG